MANYKIEKINIEVNQLIGADCYYFIYDADKVKLKKDITYIEPDSTEKTESKYAIFVSETEQECINKKQELGL